MSAWRGDVMGPELALVSERIHEIPISARHAAQLWRDTDGATGAGAPARPSESWLRRILGFGRGKAVGSVASPRPRVPLADRPRVTP